jgi:gamma-glutamylcyclotransferase (GGCT)/AIG2-like uncharacterized protein YtfP
MTNLLFVYGTLRRSLDGKPHPFLSECEYVGEAYFNGKIYDLGAFPGAMLSDNPNDLVKGEVYRLHQPEPLLAALDLYEGAVGLDRLYRRELAEVVLEDGCRIGAYIYIFNHSVNGYTRIESGDYVEYLRETEFSGLDEFVKI